MRKKDIRLFCASAVVCALVFIFTAFVQIPSHTGYVHFGDGLIFFAATLFPSPYAAFIGATGACLADCVTGFAVWAPASLVIKAASALFFSSRKKMLSARNLFALFLSFILCIAGYYLWDFLITGNPYAALSGIPGYAMQCLASGVLYVALALGLDKRVSLLKILGLDENKEIKK